MKQLEECVWSATYVLISLPFHLSISPTKIFIVIKTIKTSSSRAYGIGDCKMNGIYSSAFNIAPHSFARSLTKLRIQQILLLLFYDGSTMTFCRPLTQSASPGRKLSKSLRGF